MSWIIVHLEKGVITIESKHVLYVEERENGSTLVQKMGEHGPVTKLLLRETVEEMATVLNNVERDMQLWLKLQPQKDGQS